MCWMHWSYENHNILLTSVFWKVWDDSECNNTAAEDAAEDTAAEDADEDAEDADEIKGK